MARGMPCPYCGFPARVVSTDVQPKGTYVVYACQNADCKSRWTEKVFEEKR